MPLPKPRRRETERDFVSRCLADSTVRNDFRDNEARAAVCFRIFRERTTREEFVPEGKEAHFASLTNDNVRRYRRFPKMHSHPVEEAVESALRVVRGEHTVLIELGEDRFPVGKPTVDKEKGVIQGVKVLGTRSLNGRRYTEQAIREARSKYEGAFVNLNHPERNPGAPRNIRDRFGQLEGVEARDDGIYATLRYNRRHPEAGLVEEFAESMPSAIGLSHNAKGRGRKQGNEFVVEEIVQVRHVDLVADPATTKSLFEHSGDGEGSPSGELQAVLEDETLSREERRQKAIELVEEWLPEDSSEGGDEVDFESLTVEELQKKRPDLIESVTKGEEAEKELKALKEERDALKAEKALHEKREQIAKLIEEAELPEEAVTDTFKILCENAKDEKELATLIEDRKSLVGSVPAKKPAASSKPKSARPDNVDGRKTATTEEQRMSLDDFVEEIR